MKGVDNSMAYFVGSFVVIFGLKSHDMDNDEFAWTILLMGNDFKGFGNEDS